MNQKGFINIILLIIVIVVIVGAGAYFAATWQTIPAPTPIPTPSLTPLPTPEPTPTPVPVGRPNSTSYKEDGTCPLGYVDYGVPLQCVTPEYMEYCKTHPCPICLAGDTLIDTPSGLIAVKDLQVGMPVWTKNKAGERVSGFVTKTSKTAVPATHHMVHLILNDGRDLFVSSGHPTTDGRAIGDLVSGQAYDNATIVSAIRVPYGESATYDLLPSGDTGFYWANGILIGSTLH
ncbi:MAG: cellulose-binding family II protein [Parcubacteria group bacterium Gr01-1014_30]|nr:MAG: cellulose-binding family II protein [Parcubacteria group bacterium Gr01-1014_30]